MEGKVKTQKYVTVTISKIITQIATETDVPGYTEGVIEVFLPDEKTMTNKQAITWINKNNRRMKAICKFLNDNNL